jgi:hypothetical protein
MPTRRKRNTDNKLHLWEVRLVKAMLEKGDNNDQTILAYFTRPSRTINHARIKEIRDGTKHSSIKATTNEDLQKFLTSWPMIDWDNGLHLVDDELIIKAREAMLLAVQCYNNPKTWFRSEVFIVLAVIAWTYLHHAYFRKLKIDYRYKDKNGDLTKTKGGGDKFWELEECLKHDKCPLEQATKNNLLYLIDIRHEIEHRMTTRIDDLLSAKLQACCINFNVIIKKLFDARLGFDKDLSLALQFASFDVEQKQTLFRADSLPSNISSIHEAFETKLTDADAQDPQYTFRVAFVPLVVNRKGRADRVYQIVTPETQEHAEEISQILLKGVEKEKYKPKQIVNLMKAEGYKHFEMVNFISFWKSVDGKNKTKGLGVKLNDGQWYWYDSMLDLVRKHCQSSPQ